MAEDARGLASPSFAKDGAEYHPGLAVAHIAHLSTLFSPEGSLAGKRLTDMSGIDDIVGPASAIAAIVSDRLGGSVRPVRAIAFDKSASKNWALGWHQDRTICVKRREDVAGYGPWTLKQGVVHVQPPFEITARMATVRIHLDAVDEANAPLRIALGTHLIGKVADDAASTIAERHRTFVCQADAGDVWIYSTPILHASARSSGSRRRRVLQIDYSRTALDHTLEWLLD